MNVLDEASRTPSLGGPTDPLGAEASSSTDACSPPASPHAADGESAGAGEVPSVLIYCHGELVRLFVGEDGRGVCPACGELVWAIW